MRVLPWLAKKWLMLCAVIAFLSGVLIDATLGSKIDYWIHDAALVFQARSEWKSTAIIVLDHDVPMQVSRKQALPLFARAVENAFEAGAKGIYLDAQIPKEIEGVMPYALCIERNGAVRWSNPGCEKTSHKQCELHNSAAGNAPLAMKGSVFPHFRIAPYLADSSDLPDFLLFGVAAEPYIPDTGLVASDRVVTKNSPISRWFDLSDQHAIISLATFIDAQKVSESLKSEVKEVCDKGVFCRRIRLSSPNYNTQLSPKQPIIPVSRLAACDGQMPEQEAMLLKDRVVILQLTTPSESTDMLVTPMTSALLGPHLLTPGAQYLADAVETVINNDHPRAPPEIVKLAAFVLAALLSVYVGAYMKQWVLWSVGTALFFLLAALCFFSPEQQLWPVTATLFTFIAGAAQVIGIHLVIGSRDGKLIMQYMPKQIHHLLLSLQDNETFQGRSYRAIVLISDVTGYTTITDILQKPSYLLELMNDYLETSFILQARYEGWLEAYIGDTICYYWPVRRDQGLRDFENALTGAVELARLQKQFFHDIKTRYRHKLDGGKLQVISGIMDAGIGLATGTVVMGDLGPKAGVRKFGILGDPVNLAARIESLTRFFNAEIIVTADFLASAKLLGFPARRLGRYYVRGRLHPEDLYALGPADDERFSQAIIKQWETWLTAFEANQDANFNCPAVFDKDLGSLRNWKIRGLLKDGVWYLDEK